MNQWIAACKADDIDAEDVRRAMLLGVRRFRAGDSTHLMVMRSKTGTVRLIEAHHNFERKTESTGVVTG